MNSSRWFSKLSRGWFQASRVSVQTDFSLSSTMKRIGSPWLRLYLMHSCAMPVSAVMSPTKQCTRASSPLRWIAIAVPTAIGKTPPTMADE